MQKHASWKHLGDSRLTEVMKPDGRQSRLKHSRVLDEAIAAGIASLKFHPKAERGRRFDVKTDVPGDLFSIISKQQRG